MFPGAVRSNTYFGIYAAFAAYGDLGLQLAPVAIAALIPLGNVLSVIVVARGSRARGSNFGVTAELIKNPIILACVAGVILSGLGLGLPTQIQVGLDTLGKIALPLGLLVLGAGLRVRAALQARALAPASSALKPAAMPAAAFAFCLTVAATGPSAVVAVLFASLPSVGS